MADPAGDAAADAAGFVVVGAAPLGDAAHAAQASSESDFDSDDESDEEDSDSGFDSMDDDDGASGSSESAFAPSRDDATFVLPGPARAWPEATTVQHQQCQDALAHAGGSLVLLGRHRALALFDTSTGDVLARSPLLPFDVYSLAVDVEQGWVVAAGCERADEHVNVALLRIQRAAEGVAWGLPLARAPFGIGRLRRFAREQVNGVRVGCSRVPTPDAGVGCSRVPTPGAGVGSQRRRVLLVASQDRNVYVHGASLPPGDAPVPPLTVHTFPTAVNCASASPDGRFVAATGDAEELYIVGGDQGFLAPAAEGELHVLRLTGNHRLDDRLAGCQYVAWSEDSARLAVSSDTLNAVAVWAVPPPGADAAFAQLARFSEHVRPVLALAWLPQAAPGAPHLLCWAEREANAYVADVDHAAASDAWRRPLRASLGCAYMRRCGVQRLRLPAPDRGALALDEILLHQQRRRITGMCVLGADRILLAQQQSIAEFEVLSAWSKEQHRLFPAAFRAAVRTLLCIAAKPPPMPSEGPGLCDLPRDAVAHIIAFASQPQTAWLPRRPNAEDEAAWFARRRMMLEAGPTRLLTDSDTEFGSDDGGDSFEGMDDDFVSDGSDE